MVAPVAVCEFVRGELLHEVARLGVEDPEEGFVGEGAEFVADAVDVVDGVAVGEAVVGLEGAGGGGGEGAGVGGPEGSINIKKLAFLGSVCFLFFGLFGWKRCHGLSRGRREGVGDVLG